MIRLTLVAATGTLTLALAGCDQPGTTVSNNVAQADEAIPDEPGVANLPGSNLASGAPMPMDAQQAVTAMAGSDLFEIASGRLAQEKGQSSEVKSLGAMLVEEHGKAAEEMKAMLANANLPVQLPAAPPPELQARLDALRGLEGAEFDRRWLSEQVAAHQQALTNVNGFLAGAQPGPLKTHAAKVTGIVQKHLNQLGQTQL